MKLRGLQDLQEKIKNYYSKCENKSTKPDKHTAGRRKSGEKDEPSFGGLDASKYLVKGRTSTDKHVTKSEIHPADTEATQYGPPISKDSSLRIKHDAPPISIKPAFNSGSHSVFKSAMQSVISQSQQ